MIEPVKKVLAAQFEATLCMLHDCIDKCTGEHWDGLVAKYPFWEVAYHTLCFADLYLSRNEAAWVPRAVHPRGIEELREEHPSRRFEKPELVEYLAFCRGKAVESIASETVESFAAESGFPWYRGTRLEMHFINLRHIQHHTGALSAMLRRNGIEPRWVGSGWK